MIQSPRTRDDYDDRATEAAHRVLVDLGQVLAAYHDCVVLVGGWVPAFVCDAEGEQHSRSSDVDIALDARKLGDGRYARLLEELLTTGRYRQNPDEDKKFQLLCKVDLRDGMDTIDVEVDFLAGRDADLEKNRPKLLKGFRVLQANGCDHAFRQPKRVIVDGQMVSGADNTVQWMVVAPEDFLIMKAFAIAGRDKPKDAYDLCFCLRHVKGGAKAMGRAWFASAKNTDIQQVRTHLAEKFKTVNSFGPQQVVEFHNAQDSDERDRHARLAFELVQELLRESDPEPGD